MKCNYQNEKKKILISNGRTVAIIKKKYKKIYYYPIKKTPLFIILNKEKIFGESREVKIKSLKNFYIPLSYWIENKYKKKEKILYIGLSGGQGSGKTTVANILCII